MEEYRSKSFAFGRVELELHEGAGAPQAPPSGLRDLRCYSASYAQARKDPPARPTKARPPSASYTSSSSSKGGWGLMNDAEAQRKRRVASYRAYAMEGKMKGSLRKGFRWIKERCNSVVHGLW